jgi:hypothetical protein
MSTVFSSICSGKNIEQPNKLWEWVDADFEADLHKWEKNQPLIGMSHKKNQSLIKVTLGPGVISFELLGMHESECESEAQTSF